MTPLYQEILDTIRREGPISFARFLEFALYHPVHGYYANHVPGPNADFITSPSLTPWFGRLLANLFREMQSLLDTAGFEVVEVGGGNGALAASASEVMEKVSWTFVEPFSRSRDLQRLSVSASPGRFQWTSSLPAPPVVGCVIANEVLDNLTFRQFQIGEEGVLEVRVGAAADVLEEVLLPAKTGSYPEEVTDHLEAGDRFEVREGLGEFVAQCSKSLDRGYLVIIDYGDFEPALWLNRPAGTVVTYSNGKLGLNPLIAPGTCDVTSHVNFSALEREARNSNFSDFIHLAQRDALYSMGLDEEVSQLRILIEKAKSSEEFQQMAAHIAELSRLTALVQQGALGAFRVFVASHNAPSLDHFLSIT